MRKSILDVYVEVITEEEALHGLLVAPGEHVPFVGAGVSKEAGIPLADEIAADIRRQLQVLRPDVDPEVWANDYLNWDDASRRYGTSLERYGPAEDRVNYFRGVLRGLRPSFSHHALTLLMAHDKLYSTALTTNFDKLLERSFTEQNLRECQAIRMPEEAEFWGTERDKCYVFKLHGDYDTHNILNARSETRRIPEFFLDLARSILRGRGLLVLGSAGNEESIQLFMQELLASPESRVLSRGVKWGVYVGPRKPIDLTDAEATQAVVAALETGRLNRKLVELLGDMNDKHRDGRPCSVFPLWGSSHFLLRLVENNRDQFLTDSARLLLDHDQRLATLFRTRGLSSDAVDRHLSRLKAAQDRLQQPVASADPAPRLVVEKPLQGDTQFRVLFGDITTRGMMMLAAEAGDCVGIVSPEDTLLSAGGGVALMLAEKAGLRTLLNDLGKVAPIDHGTAAVTSAGNLPVQYLFHAAALDIDTDGEYHVGVQRVTAAIGDVLEKAMALGVTSLLVPLLGAGAAGLSPSESLLAIWRAVHDHAMGGEALTVTVVIFSEAVMRDEQVRAVLDKAVTSSN